MTSIKKTRTLIAQAGSTWLSEFETKWEKARVKNVMNAKNI